MTADIITIESIRTRTNSVINSICCDKQTVENKMVEASIGDISEMESLMSIHGELDSIIGSIHLIPDAFTGLDETQPTVQTILQKHLKNIEDAEKMLAKTESKMKEFMK